MFRNVALVLFMLGMFVLPILFGSIAGAVPLIIGLIWFLPWAIRMHSIRTNFPRFQSSWLAFALSFFVLFAISDLSFDSVRFGFNTFAFVLCLGVYYQFRISEKPKKVLHTLIGLAVLGLLLGFSWAIYEHGVLAKPRIATFMGGGANLVARIAILLAMFTSTIMMVPGKSWQKVSIYIVALLSALLIIVYSGSRGALLALPILLILPLLFALPTKWLKSAFAWSTVFILALCATGFIYWLDPNGLVTGTLDRLQSVAAGEGMDRSTELRYQMWQVAFQSFLEHPIIGTGWHSFVDVTKNTVLESYAAENRFFNFHSDIANFAVAGGVVGLLSYFVLLFAPLLFWDTPKAHHYFRLRLYWAVTMPILYIVLGLTDMVMGFDYPTMFYAFSFAIIWGLTAQKSEVEKKKDVQSYCKIDSRSHR